MTFELELEWLSLRFQTRREESCPKVLVKDERGKR